MPGHVVKYAPVPAGERLHQGELLAGVVRVRQSLASIGTQEVRVEEIAYPFVVVLTQDCDLSQDFMGRATEAEALQNATRLDDPEFRKRHESAGKYKIDDVLCCEAKPTRELKPIAAQQKDLWKRVIQNLDSRFHCLETVPPERDFAGQGIESLGCDFKRSFTIPIAELYRRIELGQITRRTYLIAPYAEHLLQRFCNFQARIPLPENHDVPL